MRKIIIEVGSTVTKVDCYNGDKISNLKNVCLHFKKNYKLNNKLNEDDVNELISLVNDLKKEYYDIYVCGTSIFRDLSGEEKEAFLLEFKNKTGYDFNIITQDDETKLTVIGACSHVKEKTCVMIGGGGSTEIAIYDDGIKEISNSNIGVVDVLDIFPDLSEDLATSSLEEVKEYVKNRINLPKEKADVLILAGGAHKYFALESRITYEKNTLFEDDRAPIMMDIGSRKKDTLRYFKEISMDKIRNRVDDPKWWFATRAMCAFVLVVAEELGCKYIVPTDISMVYGIIGGENENNKI